MKRILSSILSLGIIVLSLLVGCSSQQENPEHANSVANNNESADIFALSEDSILQMADLKHQSIEFMTDIAYSAKEDINGDGEEELFLLYEYPRDFLTFEVWDLSQEVPVQLAAVSDLGSLAGNGFGGIHLVEKNNEQYLCFWTTNGEPGSDGITENFYFSNWLISDKSLEFPDRFSVQYLSNSGAVDTVDEVKGCYPYTEFTESEVAEFIQTYYINPAKVICRMSTPDIDSVGNPF